MRDILLTAEAVLTMDRANKVIKDGAILVRGPRIMAVGRQDELQPLYKDAEKRHFGRAILMPGLVNTHMHSGILRGTAEALPLWDWLRIHIDPMHRVLRATDAEAASWLCYGESLLAGTTTVVDMWRFMQGSAKAAEKLGIRAVLVPYVGEAAGFDYFDTLDQNEELVRSYHGAADGRISVWVGLEHQFYATAEACKRATAICERHGVGLHTHSGETRQEVQECRKRFGLLPVPSLDRLGIFGAQHVLLAHCVWMEEEEITLLARRGVAVAHNPSSNMKLASGAAPITALLRAGVVVGIGTDGEKENNNLDMLEEIKIASLLAKLREADAAALDSWTVLRAATIEGARALGMDHLVGSIDVGKRADIIAIRADTPHLTPFLAEGPFFNLHNNIVHAVTGSDVTMTMVDGRIVVDGGQLVSGDMPAYMECADSAFRAVAERRAAWLAEHIDGAISPV